MHVSHLKKIIELINYLLTNKDLRRDTYEDHSFPLPTLKTASKETFNLHSLRNYANSEGKETLSSIFSFVCFVLLILVTHILKNYVILLHFKYQMDFLLKYVHK